MQKKTYNSIYNDQKFQRGFALIEEQSDEKETIAKILAKNLKSLILDNEKTIGVDLAGGSGKVWPYAQKFLRINDDRLQVYLIDSSKEQISKAKENLGGITWLRAQTGDALKFLENMDSQVDFVSCIHFLPGLIKNEQIKVFNQAKIALTRNGIFFAVQPNIGNPLTQIKKELIKNFTGSDYKTNYLSQLDIKPDKLEITSVTSVLKLKEEQFIDLSHFLLGGRLTGGEDENEIKKIILDKATRNGDWYEIKILNDYLIWRKND